MNYDPKMTTITNTGAGWKVTAGGNSSMMIKLFFDHFFAYGITIYLARQVFNTFD